MTMIDQYDRDPRLMEDFGAMLCLVWDYLLLPSPTPLQLDIASYAATGPKRRMIQAFRGIGKSWICATLAIWFLYREPNERILVTSASEDRAAAFTTFVKRLIDEIDELAFLRATKSGRDSVFEFDVGPARNHQAPSLKAVGITGTLTGSRASKIIADDIEVPKNSLTVTMRDRLSELVKEFDAILMSDSDLASMGMSNAEVIYLGTPQCEDSLYNKLPARGYKVRVWPARYPSTPEIYGDSLAPFISNALARYPHLKGESTEPTRFDSRGLLERELSYGTAGFNLQFQLDTRMSDADKHPLRCRDFIVMGISPDEAPVRVVWATGTDQLQKLACVGLRGDAWYGPMFYTKDNFEPYQGKIMAIDPSGRGKDETGYAITGVLNGFIYVFRARGLKDGYSDTTLRILAEEAKKYKVKEIIIESNFGDGMYGKLLESALAAAEYPCTITETRASGQKEPRIIDSIEMPLSNHRIIVDPEVILEDSKNYNGYGGDHEHEYQLFFQLSRITRDRNSLPHEDRLEAFAIGVRYWQEHLRRNIESIEQDREKAKADEELRKFVEMCGGKVPATPNWCNTFTSGFTRGASFDPHGNQRFAGGVRRPTGCRTLAGGSIQGHQPHRIVVPIGRKDR